MDGRPVDPESAWSGYAGATRADPSPGAVKRSRGRPQESCPTAPPDVGFESGAAVELCVVAQPWHQVLLVRAEPMQ